MDIKVKTYGNICELIIESGNAKIVEDVATDNLKVPKSEIEALIRTAYELSRFNKASDLDFLTDIIDTFASDTEKSHIVEYLQP